MNQPQTPNNEVATPRYELEKGVCKSKVDSLLCDPDRKVTGYFLTKENGDICMVDKGAVRWISKEEWWWLFHESDHYPKRGQLSDRDHNEVARLREELQKLRFAAQAVVDRWETPLWKDAEPTASVIYRLRNALAPLGVYYLCTFT